jgi:hypothetical protein
MTYVGDCTHLPGREVDRFDDSSRTIKVSTFKRKLGVEAWKELSRSLGYTRKCKLEEDPCVTYSRGRWRGRSAYCMHHSCIHHIWTA